MQSLHAFWTLLEARPHAQAVMAEWRRVCGDCFDAVAPLLTPTGTLATRYPPPRDGDPWMRVVHRAGDIVAVCDEGRSERFFLQETDIALHRLDLPRFRTAICGGLGLKPARTPPGDLPGLLRLGAWAPQASAAFPAVLCAFSEPEALRMALRDFLLDEQKPLFVLTPTDAQLDEAVVALADEHKCTLAPASTALTGNGDGWVATAEWPRFQSAFLERAGIKLPGPFQNKRPSKKRASRAADIEALKKALVDRIRAAAVVAEAALDNEQAIDLPRRPTKAMLGRLVELKPHTVTRCFQDSNELRRLYAMLNSPEDVLAFGGSRRRR
jgi:hypothetical protein